MIEDQEMYRCTSCGEYFDRPTFSHAIHAIGCDGSCKKCPIECGPVEEIMDHGRLLINNGYNLRQESSKIRFEADMLIDTSHSEVKK